MVTTSLVDKYKEEGRRLLLALDDAGVDITAAFWFYQTDKERWRLLLAMPIVATKGPRAGYERILEVLSAHPEIQLDLTDITVLSPSDRLPQLLKTAVRTDSTIAGIALSHDVINGTYIEDAYIYRIT